MELSAYQMLMSGVTGAIDLGGTSKDSISLRDRINKGEVAGPRLQVAGPLVTRSAFGGFPAEASAVSASPQEGADAVERLFKEGVDVIKAHSGLTREDFRRILTEPEANLIRQHQALLATEGVTLSFAEEAIDAIADAAVTVNGAVENIGARRLQTVLEKVLEEISFTAGDRSGETVTVDAAYVRDRVGELAQNADLSRFIL